MIEIAIDDNDDNKFLGKIRPVYRIEKAFGTGLDAYREKARDLITQFMHEPIVVVRNMTKDVSNNLFALALFVESCQIVNNIECAVLKVKDTPQALAAYKPYVALTIGIKYIMRLAEEDVKMIYKEISGVGYLGIEVTEDYLNNRLLLTLPGSGTIRHLKAKNVSEALEVIGTMKALSLLHCGAAVEAEILKADEKEKMDVDEIIRRIVDNVTPFIK